MRVLITGGTGSRGQELTKQLLGKNSRTEILIYSRGEHKQVEMKRTFHNFPNVKFIVGDVRDKSRLMISMAGVDKVYHLSALKHVPVCEENPYESVLTNIIGTQNVVEAAIANKVKVVVDISTDKAVDPFNTYGKCKAVGESLITAVPRTSKTKFVCIRGGNVLGTNGSVVPLFLGQIEKNNEITITDETMTRYIMSLPQAISLVLLAEKESLGGEIFVLKMKAITVDEIADALINKYGNKKTQKRVIGSRPGEKHDEVLVSQYESPNTFEFGSYLVITPSNYEFDFYRNCCKPMEEKYYGSDNAEKLSKEEFLEMVSQITDNPLLQLTKDDLANYFKWQNWSQNSSTRS